MQGFLECDDLNCIFTEISIRMNNEKYVFAQLVHSFNDDKFRHLAGKYQADRYVKFFTCWNQLLTLMFGQLSNRESLRDLIIALDAHRGKCYHLGVGKNVARSNLSKANEQLRLIRY